MNELANKIKLTETINKNRYTKHLKWLHVVFWVVMSITLILMKFYPVHQNEILIVGSNISILFFALILNISALNWKVRVYRFLYAPFVLMFNVAYAYGIFFYVPIFWGQIAKGYKLNVIWSRRNRRGHCGRRRS
ncbi:MAG: hypothetical protein COA73_07820 [Candidatus Hydrogenedentota bacterium]|nr:MAG: hypothetical protein COA73_07820 [Candidatus Hydrogenedentota bacterium]